MSGVLNLLLGAGTFFGIVQDVAGAIGFGAASLTLSSDGTYTSTGTADGDWLSIPALAEHWEVHATLTDGSLSAGTTGSWLAMTSNHTWTVTGNESATLTLQWRDKYSLVVEHTQTGVILSSTA
jgi:hypothetical protein